MLFKENMLRIVASWNLTSYNHGQKFLGPPPPHCWCWFIQRGPTIPTLRRGRGGGGLEKLKKEFPLLNNASPIGILSSAPKDLNLDCGSGLTDFHEERKRVTSWRSYLYRLDFQPLWEERGLTKRLEIEPNIYSVAVVFATRSFTSVIPP